MCQQTYHTQTAGHVSWAGQNAAAEERGGAGDWGRDRKAGPVGIDRDRCPPPRITVDDEQLSLVGSPSRAWTSPMAEQHSPQRRQ